jgi:dTDP-4-amino-4,6-dideoxygalactose transaminase
VDILKYKIKVSLYNIIISPFFYYLFNLLPFIKLGETIFKPLLEIKACPQYILERITYNYKKYCTRFSVTQQYNKIFTELNSKDIIDLPSVTETDKHLLRYPILVTNSLLYKNLIRALDKNGLGSSLMYKDILPNITGISDSMFQDVNNDFNNAQKFASQLITLPTHEAVTNKVIHKISELFKSTIHNNVTR